MAGQQLPSWTQAARGPPANAPRPFDGAPVAFGAAPPPSPGVSLPPPGQSMFSAPPVVSSKTPETSLPPATTTTTTPTTVAEEITEEVEPEGEYEYEYEEDVLELLEDVQIKQATSGFTIFRFATLIFGSVQFLPSFWNKPKLKMPTHNPRDFFTILIFGSFLKDGGHCMGSYIQYNILLLFLKYH